MLVTTKELIRGGDAPATLGGTTKIVSLENQGFPTTISLNSSDATRKIEISTDQTNWHQPTYDRTSTNQILVSLLAPMNFVRFTGLSADTWKIN